MSWWKETDNKEHIYIHIAIIAMLKVKLKWWNASLNGNIRKTLSKEDDICAKTSMIRKEPTI